MHACVYDCGHVCMWINTSRYDKSRRGIRIPTFTLSIVDIKMSPGMIGISTVHIANFLSI